MPKYNRNSPLIAVVLNTLARDFVGDGKGLNVYFVTDQNGDTVTITFDRDTAIKQWERDGCIGAVEDRLNGLVRGE